MLQTSYPGTRSWTGGDLAASLVNSNFLNSWAGLLSPLIEGTVTPNAPEQAQFISLFPISIILGIIVSLKIRDKTIIGCLILYAAFFAYAWFGAPDIVANFTLMSKTVLNRLKLALSFLDMLIFLRSIVLLAAMREEKGLKTEDGVFHIRRLAGAFFVAVLAAVIMFAMTYWSTTYKVGWSLWAIVLISLLLVSAATMLVILRGSKYFPALALSFMVVIVAGCCVNPIQHGTGVLSNSEVVNAVKEVQSSGGDDSALWMTDSSWSGQALVANGIPTITSVNAIPNLERWGALDSEGQYRGVYNRYAFITVRLTSDTNSSFQAGIADDQFTLSLTASDVPKLGARYWLSTEDLTGYNTDSVSFVPVETVENFTIYRIVY
jgi:hypothetical protein